MQQAIAPSRSRWRIEQGPTDAKVRAQKCLEVATLFEAYERLLTARQLLDFGDGRAAGSSCRGQRRGGMPCVLAMSMYW